jgi:hypothetical protein
MLLIAEPSSVQSSCLFWFSRIVSAAWPLATRNRMPNPFDSFQLPSELRELLPRAEQQTLRDEILDIHVRLLKRDPELEDNRGRGVHLWLLFDAIAIRLQLQPDFRQHVVPSVIPTLVEQIKTDLSWYPNSDENLGYFLTPVIVRWQNSNAVAQAHTDSGPRHSDLNEWRDRAAVLAKAITDLKALESEQSAVHSAPIVSAPSTLAGKTAGASAPEAPAVRDDPKVKKPIRRNQRYKTIDKALQEIAESRPRTQDEVFRSLDGRSVVIPPAEPFATARGWMAGFRLDSAAARAWLSKRWAELNLPPLPRGPKSAKK